MRSGLSEKDATTLVGVAGTSDIGKSKAAIVERFSKGFETA
jgi:hypothetical protein